MKVRSDIGIDRVISDLGSTDDLLETLVEDAIADPVNFTNPVPGRRGSIREDVSRLVSDTVRPSSVGAWAAEPRHGSGRSRFTPPFSGPVSSALFARRQARPLQSVSRHGRAPARKQ